LKFAKWVEDEEMPQTAGESTTFKEMIRTANKAISPQQIKRY